MPRTEIIRIGERPNLLQRFMRSITLGPWNPKDKTIAKYFGGGPTSTGISVNEFTALNLSAVMASVRLVSNDVAALPLPVYRISPDGKVKEKWRAHPLYRMLHDAPNPETTSYVFRQTLQAHALTWGGGFAEIEPDGTGRPKYLWQITPDRVTVERDRVGALVYRVYNNSRPDTFLAPSQIVHIPGIGWDGTQGYSVISKARESISLGLAAERFGGKFFGNGAHFGGVLEHPKTLGDTGRENLRKSINALHKGMDGSETHGFLIAEEGMKYVKLGIPPDDAQFLETRQFQITEIARWFGVPPHKIGDLSRATFSNIEHQNIEYYQTTLVHWLTTWEQELNVKLISPLERNQQLIEHVTEGLLRGDSAGRAALEAAEFNIGGVAPNEIRKLSNRNPVDGGDDVFVPLNMIPLRRVDEYIDSLIEKAKQPAQPAPQPKADEPDEEEDDPEEADRALAAALQRIEELTAANTEKDIAKRQAEQRAEDLSAANTEKEQRADELQAELAHALEGKAGAEASLAAEQSERERERHVAAAALTIAIDERDAARTERDTHLQHVALNEQRWREAASAVTEAQTALDAERAARGELASQLAATTAVAEANRGSADDAEALRVAAVAAQRAAEAEREAAIQRADAAQRGREIAEQAQQAANVLIEQRREAEATRTAALVAALRDVICDVLSRMVRREVEKARRHQATPAKLRAWVETFYADERDTWIDALEPVIRTHLVAIQSDQDPHALTTQIVEAHFEESRQQVRAVLAVEDFGPQFERMLKRWEEKRPAAVADRCVREGIAYVRRLT